MKQQSFGRVLIANRGEIAVRIIRTCRDLGLQTVAVYAAEDRNAMHVKLADDAFRIKGPTPVDAYLDVDALIGVAKRAQADAVHPGYGFLSENAEAAQAFIDAGITWVGPPPNAMREIGDKIKARKVATKVGAPTSVGTPNPVETAEEIATFAGEHGFPIAIKAANGGGGRGMRVVRNASEIDSQFSSATREAKAAFGSAECFVEKFLENPRHIETQCLADEHGNVVVLSTRDCTVQRRHQKLIEEAPAPFLTDEQRMTLIESSKAILREVGYQSAGTCEFLLAQDGTIAFLEVNSRLQVEHTVTEEVTGIDIVAEQFRIAQGGALEYSDPSPVGHSIEFRLNSEDPAQNFLPTPGRLDVFEMPSGPGVRIDAGVSQGDVVTGSFDSLLAKLIVTGKDRDQAISRAKRALSETRIAGVPTIVPFHQVVLDSADFVGDSGRLGVHTAWAESAIEVLTPIAERPAEPAITERRRDLVVEVDGRRLEVSVPAEIVEGVRPRSLQQRSPSRRASGNVATEGAVLAPMKGTVIRVPVQDGQQVATGDVVAVVEAMKMEQPLLAPRNGTVAELNASEGDSVSAGAVLMRILD
jgi:acetyl-CoA/propionyl-CoA carboxylase biotin carboxyl carrier protein